MGEDGGATTRVLGAIPRSETSELRFYVSQFRGRWLAHVRRYIRTDQYTGYTKQGFAAPLPVLRRLIQALSEFAHTLAVEEGTDIARIPKSETTSLVAQLLPRDQDGTALIDIREYVESEAFTGWTRHGFRLPVDQLPRILDLLRKCSDCLADVQGEEPSLLEPQPADEKPKSGTTVPADDELIGADPVRQVVPEQMPRFPEDFLGSYTDEPVSKELVVPDEDIIVAGADRTELRTRDGRTLHRTRSPIEARFVLYAHRAGKDTISIPLDAFRVFRAVKDYERFAADLRGKLVAAYQSRTGHRGTAERLADMALERLGIVVLPGD